MPIFVPKVHALPGFEWAHMKCILTPISPIYNMPHDVSPHLTGIYLVSAMGTVLRTSEIGNRTDKNPWPCRVKMYIHCFALEEFSPCMVYSIGEMLSVLAPSFSSSVLSQLKKCMTANSLRSSRYTPVTLSVKLDST